MPSQSRAERAWALAPGLLRVIAEGGWLTVVYVGIAVAIEDRLPVLGPIELSLLVGFGMLLVLAARELGALGPLILLVGVLAGGVVGWLASAAAREAVAIDPIGALGVHVAGWTAALAVVRGAILMRATDRAVQLERTIVWVLPLLALVWAFSAALTPPRLWGAFAVSAFWGTLVFIVAELMALGLQRLQSFAPGITDARLKTRLRQLVLVVGLAAVPLALPFAVLSGLPVADLFGPIIGPFRLFFGVLAIFFGYVAEFLIGLYTAVFNPSPDTLEDFRRSTNPDPTVTAYQSNELATLLVLALLVVALLVFAYLVFELARWLIGRRQEDEEDEDFTVGDLERVIVVPERTHTRDLGHGGGHTRLGPAHDAVGAYAHALAELDRHPEYSRVASETPRHHARRMHRIRMPGALDLGLLATDYQLARYGEAGLTAAENRRALSRLQRLRRALRSL